MAYVRAIEGRLDEAWNLFDQAVAESDPAFFQEALDLLIGLSASDGPHDSQRARIALLTARCYVGLAEIEAASGLGHIITDAETRDRLQQVVDYLQARPF